MTTIRIVSDWHRRRALDAVADAPLGHIVSIREPTRNLEQNAKLHAMIDDVARADPLGHSYDADDYKAVFVNAYKSEHRVLYGVDGRPFPAPVRTSAFSVKQCAELIELVYAFGAEHGVKWSEKINRT